MKNFLYRFRIDRFNCLAINDVDDWNCNVLLIDTGQQKVLVETGNGDAATPPGQLVERLRQAGITPDQINIVILTHADIDHIGGVFDQGGNRIFPEARLILSRKEWEYWSSKPERLLKNDKFPDEDFRSWGNSVPEKRWPFLKDKLELVDQEMEVVPGIRTIPAYGHTPGMMVVEVFSGDDRVFFIADMIYSADGEDPVWHAWVDQDPALAKKRRDQLFEIFERNRALIMGYHLPFPGLGYVEQQGTGFLWRPLEVAT
jgi:glyoxylase-like metal-dependent hydrolase (beta-lactamase superfamily II)